MGDIRKRNWLLYYAIVAGAHIVAFTVIGVLTRDWTKFFIYLAGFVVVTGTIMTVKAVRRRRKNNL
jgi:hypothetical protein